MKKNRMVIIAILVCILASAQDDYSDERQQMVHVQLEARDIKDAATLRAMLHVPRHKFVPENIKKYATQMEPYRSVTIKQFLNPT